MQAGQEGDESVPRLQLIAPLALGAALFFALAAPVSAQYVVTINGAPANVNPEPIERGGRVFVPLRGVFEQLGASVVYANGQINATGNGRTISLKIGSTEALIDGQAQTLEIAPFIENSSTYVPLRFISQALGATVNYESSNRMVSIVTAAAQAAAAAPTPLPALPVGTTIIGTLSRDISTATAQVGDAFAINLMPPYPNDDPVFTNAYIRGHVASVTRAGQGTRAQLALSLDQIVFTDGRTMPISGHVATVDEKHKSALLQQAAGALGGMLAGNVLGKILFKSSLGGPAGAVGGFLYANNLKTDFTVPKSSTITVQTDTPRRQPRRP
jgi:hypothetical protein